MGYRVKGTLKLPDGSPASNAEIEFISRKNFSPLVQELKSNMRCGPNGAYDVTLEFGEYAVMVYPGGTYPAALGTITLASDTVAGQDLPSLLQQAGWQPATPEYIQQILIWLAETDASATNSATSASAAKVSETNAKASEDSALSSKNSAASSASTATTKATEAASSASSALASKNAAAASASTAVAAADTATQKALAAAGSEASALSAATRAEQAAQTVVGAIIDAGPYNATSGVLPTPSMSSGVKRSSIWKITVSGTAGGIELGVGDSLVYTSSDNSYYKIDNTESVTSVQGKNGVVTLVSSDIGAESTGVAQNLVAQHAAKDDAHQIGGVKGLQEALNGKSAAILDAERYSLERATGGKQTIIRDDAGNANAMFVLPRFRYEDLGMAADMGSGDVTAFDFGAGSIKSEIFIGAYLASGSGAVSAPRQDPRAYVDHTAARGACAAKGAGWHLMTAHEWAAIALWCMANGYEPIGNTNWGRSHAKTWMVGDRGDNRAPGDASGTGRTKTGSIGAGAAHDLTIGGIADLVGNVWERQDGLLLQDGRFKLSTHNTQDEASWAFVDAYLDASTATGGNVILSHAVSNRLGELGDNTDSGSSVSTEWRAMAKSSSYVSSQALKRLLIEPAGVLPQGRIYMSNFGERLPFRGGDWYYGVESGLAALNLGTSRVFAYQSLGFRPAFA